MSGSLTCSHVRAGTGPLPPSAVAWRGDSRRVISSRENTVSGIQFGAGSHCHRGSGTPKTNRTRSSKRPDSGGQAESRQLIKRNNQRGWNQRLLGSPAWPGWGEQESKLSLADKAAFVSFPQAVGRADASWCFSAPSGPLHGFGCRYTSRQPG